MTALSPRSTPRAPTALWPMVSTRRGEGDHGILRRLCLSRLLHGSVCITGSCALLTAPSRRSTLRARAQAVPPRARVDTSINPAGAITGYYVDASNVYHGLVGAPDGTFTTFDAPAQEQALSRARSPWASTRRGRSRDSTWTRALCITASCALATAPSPRSMLRGWHLRRQVCLRHQPSRGDRGILRGH